VIDEHADQVTLPDSTCNSGDPGWIDDGGLGGKAGPLLWASTWDASLPGSFGNESILPGKSVIFCFRASGIVRVR
jgi:hypothetical protein